MSPWIALMVGGALGAVARHMVVAWTALRLPPRLADAWRRAAGTFLANLAGSGLAGVGFALWASPGSAEGGIAPGAWTAWYALGVLGFCGALTTFSGLMLDARRLRAEIGTWAALAYGLASFGLCAAAWYLGHTLR